MHFMGGLDAVVKYVKKFPHQPNSEDLWLAMEDLWVQSIMVDTLDGINRSMAKFEAVGPTAANKLNRKFKSPMWELDLQFGESEDRRERYLKGKIKNTTERLLGLGTSNQMVLNVWLDADPRSQPFPFVVEGEQIKAGETVEIKRIPANVLRPGLRLDEFARVEQVFDIKTIPVKRIDKLEMGYKSNRQQPLALKMAPISDKAVADAAAGAPGADGAAPGDAAPAAAPGRGDGPGAGGPGALDTAMLSPCGLTRKRYIDVTPQVRRMPIGIVVICEQAYIQDVMLALANTKLRFQITQNHFKRSRDLTALTPPAADPNAVSAPPAMPGAAPGGSGAMPPGAMPPGAMPPGAMPPGAMPPGAMPGRGSSDGPGASSGRPGGMPSSGMPGRMPGGPGGLPPGVLPGGRGSGGMPSPLDSTNTPAPEQTSNNLVELSVYGVASLYEKYNANEGEGEPAKADIPVKK